MTYPNILDSYRTTHPSIPNHSNGPNHRTTEQMRFQCHPYNCRPWMFQGSDLPTLYHEHLWTRNCPIIPRPCVSMVQSPHKDYQQSRSMFYFTLRKSYHKEAWDPTKPIHCIPPPNWWTLWTKEPMDRTIPPHHRCLTPGRLVLLDHYHISSTQQSDQFDH